MASRDNVPALGTGSRVSSGLGTEQCPMAAVPLLSRLEQGASQCLVCSSRSLGTPGHWVQLSLCREGAMFMSG